MKNSITPVTKLLKENGFKRITFKRVYNHVRRIWEYHHANEGDFTVEKNSRIAFTLECREESTQYAIEELLRDNGFRFSSGPGYISVKY